MLYTCEPSHPPPSDPASLPPLLLLVPLSNRIQSHPPVPLSPFGPSPVSHTYPLVFPSYLQFSSRSLPSFCVSLRPSLWSSHFCLFYTLSSLFFPVSLSSAGSSWCSVLLSGSRRRTPLPWPLPRGEERGPTLDLGPVRPRFLPAGSDAGPPPPPRPPDSTHAFVLGLVPGCPDLMGPSALSPARPRASG